MWIIKYMQCVRYVPYILLWVWMAGAGAQTVYVVPPDTPGHVTNYPYAVWADAATSVHVAVSAAIAQGWTNVVVSNGLYAITNEVVMTAGIHVRSWNNGAVDSNNTIIANIGTNRCFAISNINAVLDGFTVSNGSALGRIAGGILLGAGTVRNAMIMDCQSASGGGMYVYPDGVVEDAVLFRNYSSGAAGGVYIRGGTVRGCEISFNVSSNNYGGGVYLLSSNGNLSDSRIISNQCIGSSAGWGGGVMASTLGVVSNCLIAGNRSFGPGGGLYLSAGGGGGLVVDKCIIVDNAVTGANNGGGAHLNGGTLRNSLIAQNSANRGGGITFMNNNNLENCTVVSNAQVNIGGSSRYGGGIYVAASSVNNFIANCIVYFNTGLYSNWYDVTPVIIYSNVCAAPLVGAIPSSGNFADDPQFLDLDGGDYRLGPNSPCIDVGVNLDWMAGAQDLAGRPRLDRLVRRVDLGCYESSSRRGMMLGVR